MKAKTKFLKMYYKLPQPARSQLILIRKHIFISMNALRMEIEHDTELSKNILKELGYKND